MTIDWRQRCKDANIIGGFTVIPVTWAGFKASSNQIYRITTLCEGRKVYFCRVVDFRGIFNICIQNPLKDLSCGPGCGLESLCSHLNFRYCPFFSKEFLDIQTITEIRFTLN